MSLLKSAGTSLGQVKIDGQQFFKWSPEGNTSKTYFGYDTQKYNNVKHTPLSVPVYHVHIRCVSCAYQVVSCAYHVRIMCISGAY